MSRLKKQEFEEFVKVMEKLHESSDIKQAKRKKIPEKLEENGEPHH